MEYSGNYSRGGDPEAMFDEEKLYLDLLQQMGKPAVDADFNDGALSRITQLRRVVAQGVGEGSPNNGFEIAQAASPANNLKITGGDGTGDGAGRLFHSGWMALLFSDVDYTGAYDARMKRIMPQVTAVTALTLTDSAANWVVNELAGRTFTPDIEVPGTTFVVVSNTATVLTIAAGDLTVATAVRKHYRIELSTAAGVPRTDTVYLDLFLDEADELEDPNFVHAGLVPPIAAANRFVLRQFVRVKQDGALPANYVDTDGRQHYLVTIATLLRPAGVANVLTAQITDTRVLLSGAGAT